MRLTAFALAALVLAGCGAPGIPDREPDAVGTVAGVLPGDEATGLIFLPDTGYEYFDQTAFTLIDSTPLEGAETRHDVAEGAHIQVWTDACAESFPVQCDVVAVQVLD
ncbi:hypothetical protein [Demequina sp. NBRC 110053]|uniref:hypothetical protein n=1 Tax=Demequina sp. NBRC 110053 TaxID=1570342 RepID=UPI000A03F9E7|nr:hypothetical protein [Demequina sp. NBRC 110053]